MLSAVLNQEGDQRYKQKKQDIKDKKTTQEHLKVEG